MNDAIQQDVSVNPKEPPTSVNAAAARILAMDVPPQEELPEEESQMAEQAAPEPKKPKKVEEEQETEESELEASDDSEEPSESASDYDELIEFLKDNPDAYENIRIPTKINGKQSEATLKDLLRNYQLGEATDQKADSLAKERQAFETERTQQLEQLNQQLQQAQGFTQMLEQQFLNEFNNIDWNDLRNTDPAEFSARRQEFLERQQQIQHVKQQIGQNHQTQMMEQYQKHLEKEMSRLTTVIPAWADEAVARQEKMEVRDYLIGLGVPQEQIDGRVDHNGNIVVPGLIDSLQISIARKAMLYDREQKKVEVTKKKVKTVPKMAKPGKPKPAKEEAADEDYRNNRAKLKKTGKMTDAIALINKINSGGL